MRSTACRIALAFLLSQGPALKRLSTVACRRRRGDHGQEGAVSARDIPERVFASSAQEDASPIEGTQSIAWNVSAPFLKWTPKRARTLPAKEGEDEIEEEVFFWNRLS